MSERMTATEAAAALGYHVNHVYRLLTLGLLKGEKFGGVWILDPGEVERLKAKQEGGRLPDGFYLTR